jgi:hypothetical protein
MRTIFAALGIVTMMALPSSSATLAQGVGAGPVGTQCKADIAKFCAGAQHGSMAARACLDANRDKVSDGCRRALDTTGGGRGQGRNRQR